MEWLRERCKHTKFLSKNEKLCADLIKTNLSSNQKGEESNDNESADDVEQTTTPFTTPTTVTQEDGEVTTETQSTST